MECPLRGALLRGAHHLIEIAQSPDKSGHVGSRLVVKCGYGALTNTQIGRGDRVRNCDAVRFRKHEQPTLNHGGRKELLTVPSRFSIN